MSKKIEIIPAILPYDYAELEDKVSLITGFVKSVQVDICDGQFVPNATWPYKKNDITFEKIIKEEEGLPSWQDLNYEFDLMVNHPAGVVDEWVIAGANRIIIHIESKGDINEAIEKLKDRVEIGIAINVETDIGALKPYIDRIQFIQCMGIDHIGFQGQIFDEKVIEKILLIKKTYPDLPISVDGGVSLETAPKLIEAGANRLVAGSAIFGDENVIDNISKFKKL